MDANTRGFDERFVEIHSTMSSGSDSRCQPGLRSKPCEIVSTRSVRQICPPPPSLRSGIFVTNVREVVVLCGGYLTLLSDHLADGKGPPSVTRSNLNQLPAVQTRTFPGGCLSCSIPCAGGLFTYLLVVIVRETGIRIPT